MCKGTVVREKSYINNRLGSYKLRVASCELWVAILRKIIYELRVTFYELYFLKNKFTSCIAAL